MKIKWKLTVASIKMFYRQREAIIWSLLLPLFIVILFGFVKFTGIGHLSLGVVNEAGGEGERLVQKLREVRTFDVTEGGHDAELTQLTKGERDLVLMIPHEYAPATSATLTVFGDLEAKPQETQVGGLLLQRILDEASFAGVPQIKRPIVKMEAVKTRNLTYMDFLLPGVLSMSIMQMGIFGVAFSFVSLKKRGILRRLWVTPINPNDFIIAQVATRLLVVLVQMSIMIGVGILFMNLHFIGNLGIIFILGLIGAVVFISFGFALAGMSKSEDQVAPLANLISLPMMALSGVFFGRSSLPGFVRDVTAFFPLTYLADGMRSVAIDGAGFTQVLPQLAGLTVWAVVSCGIAVKMFRWE